MKTKEWIDRMLRPKFHFTAKYGWINDPNGLIFYKDRFHLFFQFNPNGLVWDSMHWGHAVSDDLIHWEELPVALFPDEMGDIFSGSCIYDEENLSNLGTKENPPLLAFYTSHNMKTRREQQCIAYSLDGVNFKKYKLNPIIPGKDNTPARDPHVFPNKIKGGFSMCLTVEEKILFYHSKNLIDWEKSGEFILPEYALQGMIECPCMISSECEGKEKYVLMMSMDIPESEFNKIPEEASVHNRLMQYFVGDFDGDKFVISDIKEKVKLVDYGRDFYAGTVFSNYPKNIMMAWLGNSPESMKIPTESEGFRGILSYPRVLSLVKNDDGYFLKQKFYPPVDADKDVDYKVFPNKEVLKDGCVTETCESGLFFSTEISV